MKKIIALLLSLLLITSLSACSVIDLGFENDFMATNEAVNTSESIAKDGSYTSKEEVALYLHIYDKLPHNYLTKRDASDLGWQANKGNLWQVTDQMSIGGDSFGNREKRLPIKAGRSYYECDINYQGGHRGAERLVYSNDGLIYYTGDHYGSFTLLYGEDSL